MCKNSITSSKGNKFNFCVEILVLFRDAQMLKFWLILAEEGLGNTSNISNIAIIWEIYIKMLKSFGDLLTGDICPNSFHLNPNFFDNQEKICHYFHLITTLTSIEC